MAVSLEYPVCFVTQHTADPVHTYGTPIIVKPLPTGTLTNILVRVRVLAIMAPFIWLIIRLIRLVFSAGTVFFSHKKSANSVFQPAYNSS
jgi:hypothetical protein